MKTSPLSSPYNLKAGYPHSHAFYERLGLLTQRIMEKGSHKMQLLLKDYRRKRFSNQATGVVGSDLVCTHCTPSCRISELTRQMENNGLKTVLMGGFEIKWLSRPKQPAQSHIPKSSHEGMRLAPKKNDWAYS